MSNFYKWLREYLLERGYIQNDSMENTAHTHEDLMEKFHFHRVYQSGGREIIVVWKSHRAHNQYVYKHLNITFITPNMVDTEVMHQGHKLSVQKGELDIMLSSYLEIDPKNLFKAKGWLFEKFWNLVRFRLYAGQFKDLENKYRADVQELVDHIKQFFGLPEESIIRSVHPEKGL